MPIGMTLEAFELREQIESLPHEQRRATVERLASEGLSTPDIVRATGEYPYNVRNWLRDNGTP